LYDHYRSVRDPSLMIFVDKDAVPPFRFKAGGWDLQQTAIDLGPAMMARVAAQGFFLFRAADDEAECTELIDIPTQA
jgi:hypothetical protein